MFSSSTTPCPAFSFSIPHIHSLPLYTSFSPIFSGETSRLTCNFGTHQDRSDFTVSPEHTSVELQALYLCLIWATKSPSKEWTHGKEEWFVTFCAVEMCVWQLNMKSLSCPCIMQPKMLLYNPSASQQIIYIPSFFEQTPRRLLLSLLTLVRRL